MKKRIQKKKKFTKKSEYDEIVAKKPPKAKSNESVSSDRPGTSREKRNQPTKSYRDSRQYTQKSCSRERQIPTDLAQLETSVDSSQFETDNADDGF